MFILALSSALASPSATETSEASEPPDLSGTWKMTLSVTTSAHIPVLGDTLVVSERVNLVRIVEQDGEILQHHKTCSVHADTEQLIAKTTIPDAFVRSLPAKSYPVDLSWNGAEWRYSADLMPEQMGFTGSTMPSDADDENVEDSDQDGQPGVTVLIRVPLFGTIEVYWVQRAHTLLEGVVEPETITGQANVLVLEHRIIGASNALFKKQPTVVPVDGNTFILERVPLGTSCQDL